MADNFPPIKSRPDRKLERMARDAKSATELSDRVASSSEETAALFASEYKPISELGVDPRAK
jgi:hypothetical protein